MTTDMYWARNCVKLSAFNPAIFPRVDTIICHFQMNNLKLRNLQGHITSKYAPKFKIKSFSN